MQLGMSSSRSTAVILAAFLSGLTATAAIYKTIVFTDLTSIVVMLGVVTALVLVLAATMLARDHEAAGVLAIAAAALTIALGAVELAVVGLLYHAPAADQPAWLEELVYVVGGAVLLAYAVRLWRPRTSGSAVAA